MAKKLRQETITAWARLVRAQHLLVEQVEADLKKAGLPPLSWYDVLLAVYWGEGRARQFEIAEKTLITKYNLSRLLDRLETEGLLVRETCEEDKRGAHVVLTREGKALLRRMWPVYARALGQGFERHFTGAEIKQLGEWLGRILPES